MTSRHSRLALAVFVFWAAVFLTCARSASAQGCTATVNVTLFIDGAGKCSQSRVGAKPNFVDVRKDNCVSWAGENAEPFDLLLSAGALLFHFSSSPGTATSPPISGDDKKTIKYESLIINKRKCNNAGSLGLIMH